MPTYATASQLRSYTGLDSTALPDATANALLEKAEGGEVNHARLAGAEEVNACSTESLTIKNDVANIKSVQLGEDNDYNPGF